MDNVGFYSVGKEMRKAQLNRLAMHLVGWPSREMPSSTWPFNFQLVLLMWPFKGCPLASKYELSFLHSSSPILTLNPYIESYKHTGK